MWRLLTITVTTLVCLLPTPLVYGRAQASPDWSETVALVENAGPLMATGDSTGEVHLFYTASTETRDNPNQAAIMYLHGQEQKWSEPVDVLISRNRTQARLDAVHADPAGNLHVLWNDNQSLYYSAVHIPDAGNAAAWKTSLVASGRIPMGDLAVDPQGDLHVVFRPDETQLVATLSRDNGQTWSDPVPIAEVADPQAYGIAEAHVILGPGNVLHATWSLAAESVAWNFWSVLYSRSLDGGATWDAPREMATPRFGAPNLAVDGKGNIHLVFGRNIGLADGRQHRWSADNGVTWSQAQPLFPGVDNASGDTGGYSAALDSGNVLHLVTSIGNDNGDASAYHLEWEGDRWSEPELLLESANHAHFPRLVVTLGNRVHFFALAPRQNNSILYRYRVTDTPAQQAQVIPLASTAEPLPSVTPRPATVQPTRMPTPDPFVPVEEAADPVLNNSLVSLAIAVVPVLILVGAVVLVKRAGVHQR